ncbi:hypothetical protein KJ564_00815 [bacterium]|nr:hypothetical protein [bacterium]MBU1881333.1 hypothetical protein [bacterium]
MTRQLAALCVILAVFVIAASAQDSLLTPDVNSPEFDDNTFSNTDTIHINTASDSINTVEQNRETIQSRLALPILVTSIIGGALYLLFSRRGS